MSILGDAYRKAFKTDLTPKQANIYSIIAGGLSFGLAVWTFAGFMNPTFTAIVSFIVAVFGLLPAAVALEGYTSKRVLLIVSIVVFLISIGSALAWAHYFKLEVILPWQ